MGGAGSSTPDAKEQHWGKQPLFRAHGLRYACAMKKTEAEPTIRRLVELGLTARR